MVKKKIKTSQFSVKFYAALDAKNRYFSGSLIENDVDIDGYSISDEEDAEFYVTHLFEEALDEFENYSSTSSTTRESEDYFVWMYSLCLFEFGDLKKVSEFIERSRETALGLRKSESYFIKSRCLDLLCISSLIEMERIPDESLDKNVCETVNEIIELFGKQECRDVSSYVYSCAKRMYKVFEFLKHGKQINFLKNLLRLTEIFDQADSKIIYLRSEVLYSIAEISEDGEEMKRFCLKSLIGWSNLVGDDDNCKADIYERMGDCLIYLSLAEDDSEESEMRLDKALEMFTMALEEEDDDDRKQRISEKLKALGIDS